MCLFAVFGCFLRLLNRLNRIVVSSTAVTPNAQTHWHLVQRFTPPSPVYRHLGTQNVFLTTSIVLFRLSFFTPNIETLSNILEQLYNILSYLCEEFPHLNYIGNVEVSKTSILFNYNFVLKAVVHNCDMTFTLKLVLPRFFLISFIW